LLEQMNVCGGGDAAAPEGKKHIVNLPSWYDAKFGNYCGRGVIAGPPTSIFTAGAEVEDMNGCITQSEVTCLNEDPSHTHANLFIGDELLYLQSDADEQLLISIPFGQTVKLKGISLVAPDNEGAPTTVKLFINQPSMDFSDAEDNTPTQVLELTPDDLTVDARTDLNYVKFQYVDHITVFIEANKGDVDNSVLSSLHFFGKTIHNFDMGNLKKVG